MVGRVGHDMTSNRSVSVCVVAGLDMTVLYCVQCVLQWALCAAHIIFMSALCYASVELGPFIAVT